MSAKPESIRNLAARKQPQAPQELDPSERDRFTTAAERSVLGAILLAPQVIHETRAILRPEHFWREAHRLVFGAMLEAQDTHGALDILLVAQRLQERDELREAGGVEYLAKIAQSVPVAANLPAHVEMVLAAYEARQVIAQGQALLERIRTGEQRPEEAVSAFLAECGEVQRRADAKLCDDYGSAAELFERYIAAEPDAPAFIPTGYADLDRQIGGFAPGSYVVLAGRSGAGKSTFALNIGVNVARAGRHVAFLGLEMGCEEQYARILAAESGVPTLSLLHRTFTARDIPQMMAASQRLEGLRLAVFERITTLEGIAATAHRLAQQGKLDLLVVDYIHLVEHTGEPGYTLDRAISKRLKLLAEKLRIVVLAVAQFPNGATKGKEAERPSKYWLQGGGFMHQDPTHILLLHAPPEAVGWVECIVAKERNNGHSGASGPKLVKLAIRGELNRFENWSSR